MRARTLHRIAAIGLASCGLMLAGCDKPSANAPVRPATNTAQPGANIHEKMPVPAMTPATPQAVADGNKLFVKMNCAGCHTYTGKGFMGPDLTDSYWRYGGTPEEIYRSISEGRPQGMPAWGKALPSDDIWRLVHYIDSLPTHPGGDPTTVSPVSDTGVAVDSMPPSQPQASAR